MANAKEDPARAVIDKLLESNPKLGPQFIRLAFYDAISYDPIAKVEGPHGLIRFWDGLTKDTKIYDAFTKLGDLKIQDISNADIYQLAGVLAVQKAQGLLIGFQYGRVDLPRPVDPSRLQFISEESLQDFVPKFKERFLRSGFTAKEIVALSIAPYCWMNETDEPKPTFDHSFYEKLVKLKEDEVLSSKAEDQLSSSRAPTSTSSTTTPSATPSKAKDEASISKVATSTGSTTVASTTRTTVASTTPSGDQLNKSPTATPLHPWMHALSDPSFYEHVMLFAKNPTTMEEEYARAHKKLSELDFKYFPQSKLQEVDHQSMKHGYILAVAMTILVGFVGLFFEVMRA